MKQRQIRTNDSEYYELVNRTEERNETTNQVYNPPVVETTVNEGDTLQSLSIRYHCPISELKRLNNLHRDNEIFARRSIKVPYRAFSMVAIHRSGDSSPNNNPLKKNLSPSILKEKLASVSTNSEESLLNLNGNLDNQEHKSPVNEIIFNTRIVENNEANDEVEDVSDEEIQLLPNSSNSTYSQRDFDCSGSDWGMSWPLLLGLVLLTAFIVPLIYIFYIAEHPEKYHHHVS